MRRGVTIGAAGLCAALVSAQVPPHFSTGDAAAKQEPSAVRWHVRGQSRGTPVLDDRSAFYLTPHHQVVAVNLASGSVRWTGETGEEGATTSGSSLALAPGLVIAGDYNVVALDRATGAVRWRFVPSEGYGPGYYLGTVASGLVYAGSPAGRVYAVAADTGKQVWSTRVAADGKTTVFAPIVDGEVTVVAAYTSFAAPNAGGVVALDAATGRLLWRTEFPRASTGRSTAAAGGPIAWGGTILSASATGVIYALDRLNGSVAWSLPSVGHENIPPPDPLRPDFRALAVGDGTLVAASLSGRVSAYDLSTRRLMWSYSKPLNGSAALRIGTDERAAYVPFAGGTLVALRLTDGTELWRLGGWPIEFLAPPIAAGSFVYVGASDGFYCLHR